MADDASLKRTLGPLSLWGLGVGYVISGEYFGWNLGLPLSGSVEYPVKASLLLNFAKFAEWPAGSAQAAARTVAICVLGDDPFGRVLDDTVAGRTAGGRPLEVRRYRRLEGIESCHVLFLAAAEQERLPQALARIGAAPVLTVGDTKGFADEGVIINFVLEGSKVRFEVNTDSAERAGLKISSKLLQLAKRIVANPGARPGP